MSTESLRSLRSSVLLGTFGFAAVSLGGFSVWAVAGRWFYQNVGEGGLYAACALVFVGLAGLLLRPLLSGPNRVWRFHRAFIPAFFAYAIVWSVCWFVLKFGKGEWLGSFLGCAAFGVVLRYFLGSKEPLSKVILVLFVAHSVGYFVGSFLYMSKGVAQGLSGLGKAQAALILKLLWGLCYGLGFGAGIGYAFGAFQKAVAAPTSESTG